MSGAATAAWVGAAVAAVGTAASVYSSNKEQQRQKAAARQQQQQYEEAAEKERQAMRRQNAESADISGILQNNQDSSAEIGSTILNGAQGVTNNQLSKGNTLG